MSKKKSPNSVSIRNSRAEFLTFAYLTGGNGVTVRLQEGTIWLSQKNIGLLFETTPENVLIHLKNIYSENELVEPASAKEYLVVQTEGKRQVQHRILHYNLDAIIAVGYRVNSKRATAFQQWATGVLRDYMLQGYVMDRKRMENGAFRGEDHTKERMGLTTWGKAPGGKILKSDEDVAKNYLTEEELADLGRIVNAYLDLAESRAKRRVPMTMEASAKRLDIFPSAGERQVMANAGRIRAEIAKEHAEGEFEKHRVIQDKFFQSDFDTFAALARPEKGKDDE